jgi:hypothetical protein
LIQDTGFETGQEMKEEKVQIHERNQNAGTVQVCHTLLLTCLAKLSAEALCPPPVSDDKNKIFKPCIKEERTDREAMMNGQIKHHAAPLSKKITDRCIR